MENYYEPFHFRMLDDADDECTLHGAPLSQQMNSRASYRVNEESGKIRGAIVVYKYFPK